MQSVLVTLYYYHGNYRPQPPVWTHSVIIKFSSGVSNDLIYISNMSGDKKLFSQMFSASCNPAVNQSSADAELQSAWRFNVILLFP